MQPASQHQSPEQSPGYLLWRVTLSWQRSIRAALAPYDLTHVQFALLASLWWLSEHNSGLPSQARLAEQAGVDPMMTSQVIRKLESRGLLERQPDPADSRARRLLLRPAGRAVLSRALADVEAADQAYFAALGPERGCFLTGLAALSCPAGRRPPAGRRR